MCPQKTGLTALFLAVKNGHMKVLKKLLECGAAEEVSVAGQTISVDDVASLFKKKANLKKYRQVRTVTRYQMRMCS